MRIEVLRCSNPASRCRGLAISVDGKVVKGSCGGPYDVLDSVDVPSLHPPAVAAVIAWAKQYRKHHFSCDGDALDAALASLDAKESGT
jgi:hypothetical protein